MFFLNGAVYIFGGIVFVLFTTAEVQAWATPELKNVTSDDKAQRIQIDEKAQVAFTNEAFSHKSEEDTAVGN